MFRKVAPWYARRFGPAVEFKKRVVTLANRVEFHVILEEYRRWRTQFLGPDGELLPRYQPPPLVASFMAEGGVAEPAAIAVPRGPVEVW